MNIFKKLGTVFFQTFFITMWSWPLSLLGIIEHHTYYTLVSYPLIATIVFMMLFAITSPENYKKEEVSKQI